MTAPSSPEVVSLRLREKMPEIAFESYKPDDAIERSGFNLRRIGTGLKVDDKGLTGDLLVDCGLRFTQLRKREDFRLSISRYQ